MTSFDIMGLNKALLSAVEQQGFTTPTDVQKQAIPYLLQGHDLLGIAQTGGGKTAAFVLPLLNRLAEEDQKTIPNFPKAIILAPTRELAVQIGDTIRLFAKKQRIFHTVIFGGNSYRTQLQQLSRGVHIVVATPGRLLDHMERGTIKLNEAHTFILDEADRMLDMGFINDVRSVADQMSNDVQTVMFSATMSKQVRNLANGLLTKPKQVEVARENTVAATISHKVLSVKHKDKHKLLHHILDTTDLSKSLIFTRTKAMADAIAENLDARGFKADAIHGDRPQNIRQRILRKFRNSQIDILVATDVAARGIDVPDISHVINFDMPLEGDAYVHRIGRTGRAGVEGTALTICASDETDLLRVIERTIKQKLHIDHDHPYHTELLAPSQSFGGKKKSSGRTFGRNKNGGGNGNGNGNGNDGAKRGRNFGAAKKKAQKTKATYAKMGKKKAAMRAA